LVVPDAEILLAHVQLGDAHGAHIAADVERPIGLGKKMVGLLDALVEAKQQGPKSARVGLHLVLDERVALVKTTGFVVVVVKPVVFEADFAGHGPAKLNDFPRLEFGVEADGEYPELFHTDAIF
jgi:hypothetical protein